MPAVIGKNGDKMRTIISVILGGCFLGTCPASTLQVDGVLAVAGDGTSASYIAVRVSVEDGRALDQFRWVNNDETSQPDVYVVGAGQDQMPRLAGPREALDGLIWTSGEWIEASLSTPVSSDLGLLYAIFEFESGNKLSGIGYGQGGGLAFRTGAEGSQTLISRDGIQWNRISEDVGVLFEWSLTSDAGARQLVESSAKTGEAIEGYAAGAVTAPASTSAIHPPAPNPFNPSTVLRFHLAESGDVKLSIFNLRGQRVRQLREGFYSAGDYRVRWDGTADSGVRVSSGIYIARLQASQQVQTRRLVLLK